MSKAKSKMGYILIYILLIILGIFMIYPLVWLFLSSLKPNNEIFRNLSLFTEGMSFSSYAEGFKGVGQYSYVVYFLNSFKLVLPTVLFTVLSTLFVSYGFARFSFRFKKILFGLVISSLLMPHEVLIIPRYIMFNNFKWLDSYLPFIIPSMFAVYSFFIFMMVQFIRSIPKELDEAARIDGCNSFTILWRIIVPLCKPAIISVAIFQFVWRWNDFFNVMIYINTVSKFPVSLALRMSMDVSDTVFWNRIMAMSILTILPPLIVFVAAQKYFVEGIATTGLKG